MVDDRHTSLDQVFHALADTTRRAMIARLASGEHTVGELARPFEMSLNAAVKHVKVLERAGLVRRRVQGRAHFCSLDARPLAEAAAFVRAYEGFWSDRLDALDSLLRQTSRPES
ncbi:ArsR/SmtB family transcription factor [Hansschlegelia beijingensis]|uniref:ArsR/SmtB family transcription factor n=1 Tax=Hansschlegelia beijingensis TaxID=1133344 RepID=UPI0038088150